MTVASSNQLDHKDVIPTMCCQEISKRFGGLVAVNQVSLDIFPGEVVCIVGDNGAGKSTLVNMISGVYQPDSGKIFVSGKEVAFGSPKIARDMRDVFSVADRIVVMLRGRKVADLRAHETDEDEVLSYIIGKNSLIKE